MNSSSSIIDFSCPPETLHSFFTPAHHLPEISTPLGEIMEVSKHIFIILILMLFPVFGMGQDLTQDQTEKIKTEINQHFDHSLLVGEELDVNKIIASVDDSEKAGFIDNGTYFTDFSALMSVFKERIQGIDSQKLILKNRKVTVLSENSALLTASGTSEVYLSDGRNVSGDFNWTLVYLRKDGEWKIIHTHM